MTVVSQPELRSYIGYGSNIGGPLNSVVLDRTRCTLLKAIQLSPIHTADADATQLDG